MKMTRNWLIFMMGVMMLLSLFGCGKKKHRLLLDAGLTSAKESYAEGEKVTVCFSMIATDTDYRFYSNDVRLKQGYEEKNGYVLTFTMPAHDVRVSVTSHNSMIYDPNAEREETEAELIAQTGPDSMVFDYYEAVTGTDGYDENEEYVLYRRSKGDLIMVYYTRRYGEKETARACKVPDSVLHDALDAADAYGMRSWKDGYPIDGMAYVVKFREADQMIRAASDNMPENGRQAFYAVKSALQKAWSIYGPKGPAEGTGN